MPQSSCAGILGSMEEMTYGRLTIDHRYLRKRPGQQRLKQLVQRVSLLKFRDLNSSASVIFAVQALSSP